MEQNTQVNPDNPPPYTPQAPVTAQPAYQPQLSGTAQPGYPTQSGYPGQPGYPAQPGFPAQPGYPAQPGQQPQPGYSPQYGYPQTQQPGYPPQPTQHVQQSTTVVNMQAPAPTIIMPMAFPPPNWLALSIFTCLFCFPILGIAAIIFSIMVDSSYAARDYDGAWRNSQIAKWLNIISIAMGCFMFVLVIILIAA